MRLFLDHLAEGQGSPSNTISAYQNDLTQFCKFVNEQVGAQESADGLRPDLLGSYVFWLRDRGYAQASVARKIAAVKSFLRYAHSRGLTRENPAASLGSPRVQRGAPRAASPEEVRTLLETGCAGESPDALRDRAMFTLLYHSGLRVSELVALNIRDIDLDNGSLRCSSPTGRAREIRLPMSAQQAVADYLANGRARFERGSPSEALFLNQRGDRLTRQGFWLIMKLRAHEGGIDGSISPHALRHSFAFEQLRSGTPLRDLRALLGHVNLSSTRVYTSASLSSSPPPP